MKTLIAALGVATAGAALTADRLDLAGINAYYTLLAMEMNMAQYRVPKDGAHLSRFPD